MIKRNGIAHFRERFIVSCKPSKIRFEAATYSTEITLFLFSTGRKICIVYTHTVSAIKRFSIRFANVKEKITKSGQLRGNVGN